MHKCSALIQYSTVKHEMVECIKWHMIIIIGPREILV